MSPLAFWVTSRRALPNSAAALSVVITVRSEANRNSASATLAIVRRVRRLCRPRLARRSGQNFIAPTPATAAARPRRLSLLHERPLLEVELALGPRRRVRVVGHHDDRLAELAR